MPPAARVGESSGGRIRTNNPASSGVNPAVGGTLPLRRFKEPPDPRCLMLRSILIASERDFTSHCHSSFHGPGKTLVVLVVR